MPYHGGVGACAFISRRCVDANATRIEKFVNATPKRVLPATDILGPVACRPPQCTGHRGFKADTKLRIARLSGTRVIAHTCFVP